MLNPQDIRVQTNSNAAVLGASTLNTGTTASFSTTSIDLGGSGDTGDFALFLLRFGTNAASANISSVTVDTSENNSTWTTGSNILSAALSTDPLDGRAVTFLIDGRNKPRYLRLTLTTSAAANTVISYVEGIRLGNSVVPPAVLGADLAYTIA